MATLSFWNLVAKILEQGEIKVIDTTIFDPIVIGGTREKWLFQCNNCGYSAFFILWKGSGMSTGCERCPGDMEREVKVMEEAKV